MRPLSAANPGTQKKKTGTLTIIRPFSSSGDGKATILGCSSTGTLTSADPKAFSMMSTSMSCCANPQCTSQDNMTGYGEETKAYLAMA
jgi:hypothetical protein